MLRKGTLHLYERETSEDGTYRAITLINRPPGIMAWAGRLYASAVGIEGADIVAEHYQSRQTVSFATWRYVWEYFASTEFSDLATELKKSVDAIYAPSNSRLD